MEKFKNFRVVPDEDKRGARARAERDAQLDLMDARVAATGMAAIAILVSALLTFTDLLTYS